MTRIFGNFSDPIFANALDMEQDVTGMMFVLVLAGGGNGTEVYRYDPWKQTTTLVVKLGTFYKGNLYVSWYNGLLYACNGNQDGKSGTISDPIPGWTAHPALIRQGLT